MKILIVRTDRLGDTILSSPTWQSLKAEQPDARVTLLAREDYRPLFANDPLLDEVLPMPGGSGAAIAGAAREISARGFDAVVALHVDGPAAALIRRVSAPVKIGPLSQLRTWFLFNKPVRQGRSAGLYHEADYNGRLLEPLGISYRPSRPTVHLSADQRAGGGAIASRFGGDVFDKPYVVVHPGMGGSALNWPAKRYAELVRLFLRERPERVVMTGLSTDTPYLGPLLSFTHDRFINAVGKLDLVELAVLLEGASFFFGPSTGPMHLATALDTPVAAIFSPLRVQHKRRWGPYHAAGTVHDPAVDCPAAHRCRGSRCPYYDCMDTIAVGEVLKSAYDWL